jgi:hypothetical protein
MWIEDPDFLLGSMLVGIGVAVTSIATGRWMMLLLFFGAFGSSGDWMQQMLYTPLDYAVRWKKERCIAVLHEMGAQISLELSTELAVAYMEWKRTREQEDAALEEGTMAFIDLETQTLHFMDGRTFKDVRPTAGRQHSAPHQGSARRRFCVSQGG